jgi:proliferating cell nuclear antigen
MVDEDKFTAEAEGEFGDAKIEYLHGEKIDTKSKSIFSLEKIKEMLKADKFSDAIVLKLGNDMPLNLSLKMATDEGELSFLLAPRIESEE